MDYPFLFSPSSKNLPGSSEQVSMLYAPLLWTCNGLHNFHWKVIFNYPSTTLWTPWVQQLCISCIVIFPEKNTHIYMEDRILFRSFKKKTHQKLPGWQGKWRSSWLLTGSGLGMGGRLFTLGYLYVQFVIDWHGHSARKVISLETHISKFRLTFVKHGRWLSIYVKQHHFSRRLWECKS